MDSPTIGRIVRYVMDNGDERPALVVHVASQVDDVFKCDLHVFTRGDRDNIAFGRFPTRGAGMALVPDVRMGDGPRTFHFPERIDPAVEREAKIEDAFLRLEVMIAKLDAKIAELAERVHLMEPPEAHPDRTITVTDPDGLQNPAGFDDDGNVDDPYDDPEADESDPVT